MKEESSLPILLFASQKDWEVWLHEHHSNTPLGIWLKFAKKASGILSVSYVEAVESALCYGWIDGQKASFDTLYWLQKFTPRRAKSVWSKVNCAKSIVLIEQGRMQPSGLHQIESAEADGRWDAAYDGQSSKVVPQDLQAELDRNDDARLFFDQLNNANRYAILFRIQTSRNPDIRVRRIATLMEKLSRKEKFHP